MNIYRCVSEELSYVEVICDDGTGPLEYYCIAELVAAETRGRAKWLAYKSDHPSYWRLASMDDMPKFSVVCTRKNVNLPEGVIANYRNAWWDSPAEIRKLWRERHVSPDGWLSPESKLAYQAR